MMQARNIKIENNILTLEYKLDHHEYEKLEYDINQGKITSLPEEDLCEREIYVLYSHLINPILDMHKKGNLEETFFRMWC